MKYCEKRDMDNLWCKAYYDKDNKKIYINPEHAHTLAPGGIRPLLSHEYSHMLFDLLPKETNLEVIAKFTAHPSYLGLKQMMMNPIVYLDDPNKRKEFYSDRRIVDELLAKRSEIMRRLSYEKQLKQEYEKQLEEEKKGLKPIRPIDSLSLEEMVQHHLKTNLADRIQHHERFLKLLNPITTSYIDSLGFDKPFSTARALREMLHESSS